MPFELFILFSRNKVAKGFKVVAFLGAVLVREVAWGSDLSS